MIWCILTELLECKVHEKRLCLLISALFRTLSCNNSVRKHQITMVLWQFLIGIQCTVRLCKLILNWASSIFIKIWTIWFYTVWTLLASDLMPYVSKATKNWHVQHWFSHCRCNVASFKCKNNFPLRGCNRFSKKCIWLLDYIGEIIGFHRTLKDEEIFYIHEYLMRKWGITNTIVWRIKVCREE